MPEQLVDIDMHLRACQTHTHVPTHLLLQQQAGSRLYQQKKLAMSASMSDNRTRGHGPLQERSKTSTRFAATFAAYKGVLVPVDDLQLHQLLQAMLTANKTPKPSQCGESRVNSLYSTMTQASC